ncbi:MAG: hypothetical protein ACC656_06425, partial [Candidatus Heimdallarchaeota archaeon]
MSVHLDLLGLFEHLKKLGFKISISEVIEANKLLLVAENTIELKFGLRMILAKSKQEQDLFDLVWENLVKPLISKKSVDKSDDRSIDNSGRSDDENGGNGTPPQIDASSNLQAAAFGRDGTNALSIALSRSGSSFKGIVRQLLGGNDRNAAAIMLRYMLAQTMNVQDLQNKQDSIR